MQQVDLEQRLKKLLMDRVGVPEKKIKPEASLADDLSLDSLDGVELAMAIEEEFNLQLDDGQMKQLVKPGGFRARTGARGHGNLNRMPTIASGISSCLRAGYPEGRDA